MELTWMVPVALILTIGGYLVVARVIGHRERMAGASSANFAALTARVEALEAAR